MKIGVFSDTHGDIYALKRAIKLVEDADVLIHLGDYCRDAQNVSKELKRDIIYVRGNCDYSYGVEYERIITIENKKILVTHGHNYNVKSDYIDIYFKAAQEEVDACLFGHTHFAETFEKDGILFFNPGSLSRPRAGVETYGLVTVESGFITANIVPLY